MVYKNIVGRILMTSFVALTSLSAQEANASKRKFEADAEIEANGNNGKAEKKLWQEEQGDDLAKQQEAQGDDLAKQQQEEIDYAIALQLQRSLWENLEEFDAMGYNFNPVREKKEPNLEKKINFDEKIDFDGEENLHNIILPQNPGYANPPMNIPFNNNNNNNMKRQVNIPFNNNNNNNNNNNQQMNFPLNNNNNNQQMNFPFNNNNNNNNNNQQVHIPLNNNNNNNQQMNFPLNNNNNNNNNQQMNFPLNNNNNNNNNQQMNFPLNNNNNNNNQQMNFPLNNNNNNNNQQMNFPLNNNNNNNNNQQMNFLFNNNNNNNNQQMNFPLNNNNKPQEEGIYLDTLQHGWMSYDKKKKGCVLAVEPSNDNGERTELAFDISKVLPEEDNTLIDALIEKIKASGEPQQTTKRIRNFQENLSKTLLNDNASELSSYLRTLIKGAMNAYDSKDSNEIKVEYRRLSTYLNRERKKIKQAITPDSPILKGFDENKFLSRTKEEKAEHEQLKDLRWKQRMQEDRQQQQQQQQQPFPNWQPQLQQQQQQQQQQLLPNWQPQLEQQQQPRMQGLQPQQQIPNMQQQPQPQQPQVQQQLQQQLQQLQAEQIRQQLQQLQPLQQQQLRRAIQLRPQQLNQNNQNNQKGWNYNRGNAKNATPEEAQLYEEIRIKLVELTDKIGPSALQCAVLNVEHAETLHKNNIEICDELFASKFQFSKKFRGVVLHGEQNDSNLELKANNIYLTLLSVWNALKDTNKEELFIDFFKNAFISNDRQACLEGRFKVVDTWHQKNKALLKNIELSPSEKIKQKTVSENVLEQGQTIFEKFMADSEAGRKLKRLRENSAKHQARRDKLQIDLENPANDPIKIAKLKEELEDTQLTIESFQTQEAKIAPRFETKELYQKMLEAVKAVLVNKEAKDGQISLEQIKEILTINLVWDID